MLCLYQQNVQSVSNVMSRSGPRMTHAAHVFMSLSADHVKKHFLRIHKGLEYDVKLTKRIRGVDYDAENSPATSAPESGGLSCRQSDGEVTSRSFLASHLVNCLVDANQRIIRSSSPHHYLNVFTTECQAQDVRTGHSSPPTVPFSPLRPVETTNRRQLHDTSASDDKDADGEKETNGSAGVVRSFPAGDDESSSSSSPSLSSHSSPPLTHFLLNDTNERTEEKHSRFPVDGNEVDGSLAMDEATDGQAVEPPLRSSEVRLSSEYECEFCGAVLADHPSLHTHRYLLHRDLVPKDHSLLSYCCASCGHMTSTQKAMVNHMSSHYSRSIIRESADSSKCYSVLGLFNSRSRSHWSERSSHPTSRRKQIAPRKVLKSVLSHDSEDSEIRGPGY